MSLPGMEVQCSARTSGLQTGRILPALASVKIYGRASPSHTYEVSGRASPPALLSSGAAFPSQHQRQRSSSRRGKSSHRLGIPGDSGAWVIDRRNGRLAGHVLAWSERKQVAYICPMDVLLLDIAETLEATEVRLPGGEAIIRLREGAAIAAAVAASTTVSRQGYVDVAREEVEEDFSDIDSVTGAYGEGEEEKEEGSGMKERVPQLLHSAATTTMPEPVRSPPPPPPPPKDSHYDAARVRALTAEMEKVHIPSSEIGLRSR